MRLAIRLLHAEEDTERRLSVVETNLERRPATEWRARYRSTGRPHLVADDLSCDAAVAMGVAGRWPRLRLPIFRPVAPELSEAEAALLLFGIFENRLDLRRRLVVY